MQIPSDDILRENIQKTLEADPKLKCCANCCHYSLVTNHCSKIDKTFPRYMYGCKHYITAEDMLIAKARENLIEQARECEKIELLLAVSLTSAGMTSLFIEDFERRVKTVYHREKESESARNLREDLTLGDQMRRSMKNINQYLEKIESQYRLYFQAHLDKIFKKEGIPYNAEGFDQFQSDAGEFAMFILEMARVAHHNKENMDKVYQYMQTLNNDKEWDDKKFCLDPEDIRHYRMRI